MKFSLFLISILLIKISWAGNDFQKVRTSALKYVISICEKEIKGKSCLIDKLNNLITKSEQFPPSEYELICRVNNSKKYAAYNLSKSHYIDENFQKTQNECLESIKYSFKGFICVIGANLKFSVKDLKTNELYGLGYFMDYYTCKESVRLASKDILCLKGANGKFSRFSFKLKNFIDPFVLTFRDCFKLI